MKTEDEIRAGLQRYAETTTTSAGAWDRINEQAAAAPARRRSGAWAVARPLLAAAAAIAVVVGAVAVAQDDDGTTVTGFTGAPLRGTVFAFGISTGLDDVVRIDLASGRTERFTARPQNHAGMTVVDGVVYVAAGCGLAPGLLRLDGAALKPVPGAPARGACSVGPGPNGTVLWVAHDSATDMWDLRQWDPRTSTDRVLVNTNQPLAGPAANAAGDIAHLEADLAFGVVSGTLKLIVMRAGGGTDAYEVGTLARTTEGTSEPAVSWGARGLVAVASPLGQSDDDEPSTVIIDTASRKVVKRVKGWAGTAWSPDGSALLVADGARPSRLAVLRAPKFQLERLPQRTAGWAVGRPVAWLGEEFGQSPPSVVEVAAGEVDGRRWSVSTYHENGKGCVELRGGGGGRSRRCDAPELSGDVITGLAAMQLGFRTQVSLNYAWLPNNVDAMTIGYPDGRTVPAQVMPVLLDQTPLRMAVWVGTTDFVRLEAGGVVMTCAVNGTGCSRSN